MTSIAFDASAELELRAGYAATHEPRFLLEAAQAAVAGGHYGAAIVTVRQVYPQLDTHQISEVPRDVWLAAYALPFDGSIRQLVRKIEAGPDARRGIDSSGVRIFARSSFQRERARADAAHSGNRAENCQTRQSTLLAGAAFRTGLQRTSRDHLSRKPAATI